MNGDAIFDDKSWPAQFALRRTTPRVSLHFGQVIIDIDDDDTANRHHARRADMSGVDRHATEQAPRRALSRASRNCFYACAAATLELF